MKTETKQRIGATVITLGIVLGAGLYLNKPSSEVQQQSKTGNKLSLKTGDADNPNDTIRVLKEEAEAATNLAKQTAEKYSEYQVNTSKTIDSLKSQIDSQGKDSIRRTEQIQSEISQTLKNFGELMKGQKQPVTTSPVPLDENEWVTIEPVNSINSNSPYQVEKINYEPKATESSGDFLFENVDIITDKDEEQFVPIATIPKNSVILNAETLTTLIGRIPVNGNVFEAYEFSVITSADNFTPHEHEVPFLENAIWSGVATGDKDLRCVRGDITSVTFVFTDESILTVNAENNKPLATITTDTGISCVPGEYVTNLPKYIAALGVAGAVAGIGEAVAEDETVNTFTSGGTALTRVTGDTAKFIAGRAIESSASAMTHIIENEYANSYSAVVKPPGQVISMIMKEQVNIDYNLNARKVTYVNPEDYDE